MEKQIKFYSKMTINLFSQFRDSSFRMFPLAVFGYLLFVTNILGNNEIWQQKKIENGNTVIKWKIGKTSDGQRRLMIFSIKMDTDIDMKKITSALKKSQSHRIIQNDSVVNELNSGPGNDKLLYSVTDFPWPLDNFETALRMKVLNDIENKIFIMNLKADSEIQLNFTDKLIRNNEFSAVYEIKSNKNGATTITLNANCMPPIEMPAWILNKTYYQIPLGRINRLLELAEKEK